MKKLLIVMLALMTFFLIGCGEEKEDKLATYREVMGEYSKDYFDNYVSGIAGLDVLEVTIGMLENANAVGDSNYDLTELENCDKTSKTKLFLTDDGMEIKKYEYNLDCDEK